MIRITESLLRVVTSVPVYVCSFAFIGGFICQIAGPAFSHFGDEICFPLSRPEDVVADQHGRIYVSLKFYCRVQVYDRTGRFLFGFFTNQRGSLSRLYFDSAGCLNVVTRSKVHTYNRFGTLRSSKRTKRQLFDRLSRQHAHGYVDTAGNRYCIHNPLTDPEIVRIDPTGQQTLRIATRWLLWPLIGPLPCWLTVMLAGSLAVLARYWKADHRTVRVCEDLFPNGRIRRSDVLLRHNTYKRDVILTRQGVCWARSVWQPYFCIPFDRLQISVTWRWCFKPILHVELTFPSERRLSFPLQRTKLHQWLSQIERGGKGREKAATWVL